MEMGKLLLLLAFICLTTLTLGTTLFPHASMFWLASGGFGYALVRTVLGAVLLIQFITDPPRHVIFRILAGLLAACVGVWALEGTYSNNIAFLDSLSFLAAAMAMGSAALEISPPPEPTKKRPAKSHKKALAT